MRGSVAKRIRAQARSLSKSESAFRKTYKHLKSMYRHNKDTDVIGNAERKAKVERELEEKAALDAES